MASVTYERWAVRLADGTLQKSIEEPDTVAMSKYKGKGSSVRFLAKAISGSIVRVRVTVEVIDDPA